MQSIKERLTGVRVVPVDGVVLTNAAAKDQFHAPFCLDIGGEYASTFSQPSCVGAKRLVVSTPNLASGAGRSLSLTMLHESRAAATDSQEQLTANGRWCHTFGPMKVLGFTTRPVHYDVSAYGCLPTHNNSAQPTVKLTTESTDLKSGIVMGGSTRLSGAESLNTLNTRGKYGTFTLASKNDSKLPQYRTLSSSVAATLYRDKILGRSVTAGVHVDSAVYNTTESQFPSKLNSVTVKAEYDEQQWTIDTSIQAKQHTQPGSDKPTLKIADAHVRAVYAHNLGAYPRWCAGVSVGVIGEPASTSKEEPSSAFRPYDDPDTRSDKSPVASTAFYYQLNPNNKLKTVIDSDRRVASSYQYTLANGVKLATCFNATFPALSGHSLSAVRASAAGVKTDLGFAIHVNAD